ncbi:MAG: hypothetical protein M5R36_22395 [Deltaproteobacteria bacterium]|nr:hypothetical protein [Deltaproteobacteria bacterium]
MRNDDDDDDNDDDDDGFQASSITFEPSGSGGAGSVWLELAEADPETNSFSLNVLAQGLGEVYGLAGALRFDGAVAQMQGAEAGPALEGDGATVIARGAPSEDGGVFGASRSVVWQASALLQDKAIVAVLRFGVGAAGRRKSRSRTPGRKR